MKDQGDASTFDHPFPDQAAEAVPETPEQPAGKTSNRGGKVRLLVVLGLLAGALALAVWQQGWVTDWRSPDPLQKSQAAECRSAQDEIRDLEYRFRAGDLPPSKYEERLTRELLRAKSVCRGGR